MANTPSKKFMLVKALGKIKRVFFKIGLQKKSWVHFEI